MTMFGVISNLVVIAWLIARVSGSAVVRNKRQWTGLDPYGRCGKPTTPIPHGGIKLFPISDIDDPRDNSCYTISSFGCEPKFYCNDGYAKKGDFHLECIRDLHSGAYKWEGSIPTCEEITVSGSAGTLIYVIPGLIIPLTAMCAVIIGAFRSHMRKNRATRPAQRTGVRSTIIHITPSSRAPGRQTLGFPTMTGPPGYSRFDDSNVNVPRDEITPITQGAEVAPTEEVSNAVPPPSYREVTTEPTVATTEEVSHDHPPPPYPQEGTVEPASASVNSQRIEDNPVAVITST